MVLNVAKSYSTHESESHQETVNFGFKEVKKEQKQTEGSLTKTNIFVDLNLNSILSLLKLIRFSQQWLTNMM